MLRKNTLLFFALVVISLVLMTYQSKKGRLFSMPPLDALLDNSQFAAQSLTDIIERPFRRMALREEENTRLKKEVAGLLLERQKYQEVALENKRLRELLKFRETQKDYIATCRIIARGIDHWSNTLLLDKGAKEGLAKDMTAVTPSGLAGKITDVTDSYAHLLLLTDINFSAAVRLQESRREAIVSGTGTGKCVLKYVPPDEVVKPGDVVVTSGLDALFPPGIPVGYVSKVDVKGSGTFQYIEVVPYQDDTKMEEVIVIR
jgi:rod shape-determining protein MreC